MPQGVTIPEVPTNIMLITFAVLCVFAQWAVYAVQRADRVHAGLALGLTGLFGLAIINAQAYVYSQIELPIADGGYAGHVLRHHRHVFALHDRRRGVHRRHRVPLPRRSQAATARSSPPTPSYWYFLAAVYAAMWFVVYVTK